MGKDRFEDLDFIDFNDSRRQEGTVIADMLSAVYRNRKWFILSVAVCVLIGFLYLKSSPKIFFFFFSYIYTQISFIARLFYVTLHLINRLLILQPSFQLTKQL